MLLLRDFFCHFIEIPWLGQNSDNGCFQGRQIQIHCENWSSITFGWSVHHFCKKMEPISRMICCTASATSPSCFWLNFIKGWGTYTKILYSAKMGEIALTFSKSGFFTQFIKIALFGQNNSLVGFRGLHYRIHCGNWVRTKLPRVWSLECRKATSHFDWTVVWLNTQSLMEKWIFTFIPWFLKK